MGHDKYLALPPAREEKQPRFLTEPEYKRLIETVRFQVWDAALRVRATTTTDRGSSTLRPNGAW